MILEVFVLLGAKERQMKRNEESGYVCLFICSYSVRTIIKCTYATNYILFHNKDIFLFFSLNNNKWVILLITTFISRSTNVLFNYPIYQRISRSLQYAKVIFSIFLTNILISPINYGRDSVGRTFKRSLDKYKWVTFNDNLSIFILDNQASKHSVLLRF